MPLNDRPWFRRILLASTVIWLVLGVGFWAHLDSRPTPLPEKLVVAATVVDRSGQMSTWADSPFAARADQDDLQREFTSAAGFLSAIGVRFEPVRFELNYKSPQRYLITARRVELGNEIAMAKGHARHAIFKAWVLQNAGARFAIPVFRQDVISDLMLAIADNGLRLGVPGQSAEISYDDSERATFYQQIATFGRLCRSDWKPNDLLGFCNGIQASKLPVVDETSPFSLRRAVGEAVWRSIEGLNAFERLAFTRAWLDYLAKPESSSAAEDVVLIPESMSLWAWRDWARGEFAALLPASAEALNFPKQNLGNWSDARLIALERAGLDMREELKLDIVARFESTEAADAFEKNVFAKAGVLALLAAKTAVVNVADNFFLLPGGTRLSSADLKRIRARAVIWDGCTAPDVQDVVGFPVNTDRALVVENCKAEADVAHYRSFIRYGVEGFALDNPDRKFVQVHRPSLEFAMERGWIRAQSFISGLIGQGRPAEGDRKLGLSEANWNPQMKAYRVLGAVEAVEWFRPSP